MSVRSSPRWGPLLVLVAGMVWTLVLLSTVRNEVLFNGDGGLKALMAKQFARGLLTRELRLEAPAWVRDLWEGGLYPFEPPFVYRTPGGGHQIAFPLLFPLLSAPFYRLGGYRGLYVLPVLSLWVTWLLVDRIALRLGQDSCGRTRTLATLVFASPLTLYGAMFWEHTLAVALTWAGVLAAIRAGPRPPSTRRMLFAGTLMGISAWFRPETVALLLGAAVALAGIRQESRRSALPVGIGALGPILALVALNSLTTGHPLGYHGLQVTTGVSLRAHAATSLRLLAKLPLLFAVFFPSSLGAAVSLLSTRHLLRPLMLGGLVALVALVVMVPNDGGKQWGPRYFLTLVPLVALCIGGREPRGPGRVGTLTTLVVAGCCVAGVGVNAVAGSSHLVRDYRDRVAPALAYLRHDPHRVIAIAPQFVAQEFQALFSRAWIVKTAGVDDFHRLARALDAQGIHRFTYVCFANRVMPGEMRVATAGGQVRITTDAPIKRGWFLIYDASVRRVEPSSPAHDSLGVCVSTRADPQPRPM